MRNVLVNNYLGNMTLSKQFSCNFKKLFFINLNINYHSKMNMNIINIINSKKVKIIIILLITYLHI